jgi:hypothetical protein
MEGIQDLEENKPDLLRAVHNFACRQEDLGVMPGLASLYKTLVVQSAMDNIYP